jgi:hypothetical protein
MKCNISLRQLLLKWKLFTFKLTFWVTAPPLPKKIFFPQAHFAHSLCWELVNGTVPLRRSYWAALGWGSAFTFTAMNGIWLKHCSSEFRNAILENVVRGAYVMISRNDISEPLWLSEFLGAWQGSFDLVGISSGLNRARRPWGVSFVLTLLFPGLRSPSWCVFNLPSKIKAPESYSGRGVEWIKRASPVWVIH